MKVWKTCVISVMVLGLILGMTGCFVLSVHPLYFEKDLVFKPELVGTWGEKEHEKDLSELWIFKKSGDKSYQLIIKDQEEEGMFEAHLLKLGDYLFLDLYPKVTIKHERRDDTIVLTASTEELQDFVLKHVAEAFPFEQESLHRFW